MVTAGVFPRRRGGRRLASRLREVGVLRPDLLAGVNAPDGGPHRVRVALALPLLRVLRRWCRMWVVAKRLVRSNPPFSLVVHRHPPCLGQPHFSLPQTVEELWPEVAELPALF